MKTTKLYTSINEFKKALNENEWVSTSSADYPKSNKIVANDLNHLKQLIKDEIADKGPNCDLNHIDTSQITSMQGLFYGSEFNGDISQWNVSAVTSMFSMFTQSLFNGDISNWNVSNVKHMFEIFNKSAFNGDISNWNTSNVQDMQLIVSNDIQSIKHNKKVKNYV